MKNLFTYVLLLCAILAHGQFDKIESLTYGTIVNYYPNSCNTSVPDAVGKYTFCDSAGNLGVVMQSTGLNGTFIDYVGESLDANREVFVTENGISIRNSNNLYQNFPHYSVLKDNQSPSVTREVRNASIDQTGNLIYSNGSFGFYAINLNDFSNIQLDFRDNMGDPVSNIYTSAITVDRVNNITYIAATDQFAAYNIYSWDGTSLTLISENFYNLDSNNPGSDLTYSNGKLYYRVVDEMFQIDLSSSTATPAPINEINNATSSLSDFTVDTNGDIIVSGIDINSSEPSILVLESASSAIWSYDPFSSSTTQGVSQLEIYDGQLYAIDSSNRKQEIYVYSIDRAADTLIEEPELDYQFFISNGIRPTNNSVNPPTTNVYESLSVANGLLYFTVSDTNGLRDYTETFNIVRFDGTTYDPSTFDELSNLRASVIQGSKEIAPYENEMFFATVRSSGVDGQFIWSLDDQLGLENQLIAPFNAFTFDFELDTDGSPISAVEISASSSANGLYKYKDAVVYPLPSVPRTNGFRPNLNPRIARYNSSVIAHDTSNNSLIYYQDDRLTNTISLDVNNLATFDAFTPDANGNIWFYKPNIGGGNSGLRMFDPLSQSSLVLDFPLNSGIGSTEEVFVTLSGNVMMLSGTVVQVYNGSNVETFDLSSQIGGGTGGNMRADDATIGLNGDIYIPASGGLLKFNYNAGLPLIQHIPFFNNSIIPAQDEFQSIVVGDVSLDPSGEYLWMSHENGVIRLKLALADTTPVLSYSQNFTTGFVGRVYHDKNNNDSFDLGEEVPNISVAAVNGNEIRRGFTDESGSYTIPYTSTGSYDIVIPTLPIGLEASPQFLTATVTDVDQDTNIADIKLLTTDQSAIYAQGFVKEGAWGFDNRDGFDNSFVGAISNLGTNPINNVTVTYSIENADATTANTLPAVLETELIAYTPLGDDNVYENLQVNPRNHEVEVSLDPAEFTLNVENLTPTITNDGSRIDVQYTIPAVGTNQTFTIRVKTGIFDPSLNGVVLNYGVSAISSPDLNSTAGSSYSLLPVDLNNTFIEFSSERYNFVNPFFVSAPNPSADVKVFYDGIQSTTLRSSFDPNDKLAMPGVPGIVNDVSIDHKWLIYVIRFENEGNFPAQDVSIIDVLDSDLNPDTFTFLSSSHPVDIVTRVENGNSVLQFNFDNINLDFTDNDPSASQGYVQFAISADENIGENTLVENEADIYFDQNPPIRTPVIQHNFKTITLSNDQFEIKDGVSVYPNPTSGLLRFRESGNSNINSHQVYDTMGRLMLEDQTSAQETNLGSLPDGVYLLKIVTSKSTKTHKIILKR
ncbi:MAG: T9SS type A sorting domain-containing protein [Nonlabens sp.]